MILITEDWIDNLHYRAGFIGSAVDVVHRYWLGELDKIEMITFSIVSTNEFSSCSAIYERCDRPLLCCVHGFDLNL